MNCSRGFFYSCLLALWMSVLTSNALAQPFSGAGSSGHTTAGADSAGSDASPSSSGYRLSNDPTLLGCCPEVTWASHMQNGALTIVFADSAGGILGMTSSSGASAGSTTSDDSPEYIWYVYDHISPGGLFPMTGWICHEASWRGHGQWCGIGLGWQVNF